MTQFIKIKLILKGIHKNHYNPDGSYLIDPLSSSVTLIQTENKNILVDCGTPLFQREILVNLAKNNLKTTDITHLILTHNHLDHTFNAYLFPNAFIYTAKSFWHWQAGNCQIFPEGIAENILGKIKLIQTPGHTPDSLSVLTEDNMGKRWVIAGDAINLHYLEDGTLEKRIGQEGIKSIQKILAFNPDYIVPGHGDVLEKREIKSLKKRI